MIDISMQGATLVLSGGEGVESVSFTDLSDTGTPLDFGNIDAIGYEGDLNANMVTWHHQVFPTFTLSPIPNSKSDRVLRSYLIKLASISKNLGFYNPSDIMIDRAELTIPNRQGSGSAKFVFTEGYVVGGSTGIGASSDGRMVAAPYRFVFKAVSDNYDGGAYGGFGGNEYFTQTKLCVNGEEIEGLYYASVSGTAKARVISHPIETGGVIFDQKYVEPEQVNVSVHIPINIADSVVGKFFGMLTDRSVDPNSSNKTPYTIETKAEYYNNLTLIGISHAERPDRFDLVTYHLTFQELMFSNVRGATKTLDPSNEGDIGTVARGLQTDRPRS